MIRVADYIAQHLVRSGIRQVFLVTGGGAMHLNDAIGRADGLEWICCHHEQACAMAADAYFRLTGKLAAVNVTTGPGGINALNGVWGAYTDSLGMVVVSGQVKWETSVRSTALPLRQLGDQEVDIVTLVAPVTKYAAMVTDPKSIRYHLEKAIHLARTGRPGPTWIDVPMNVQGAMIDENDLPAFDPAELEELWRKTDIESSIGTILERLESSRRPVVLAGSGVRIAGAVASFLDLVRSRNLPVATAFNAADLLPDEDPLLVGRPGTVGDRAGNFAVQNADFVLVLGCRLNIRQISYNWNAFAREAFVVMVDIDLAELAKPTLHVDLPVHADLATWLPRLAERLGRSPAPSEWASWLAWCVERREKYPVVLPEYSMKKSPINPYAFVDELFRLLPENEIVVTGDGTACVATFQAARLKKGQRLFTNSGSASMGYDLPASIGASIGANRGRVVCLAGDGSIMMNLQELQTISTHRLPIRIFLLDNGGYHSIRQTQQAHFPGSPIGYDQASGVGFPDWEKLASAFGIDYVSAGSLDDLPGAIARTLDSAGPMICRVVLDPAQPFAPRLASRRLEDGRMVSSPLEDLAPFLDREELMSNLLVRPWLES